MCIISVRKVLSLSNSVMIVFAKFSWRCWGRGLQSLNMRFRVLLSKDHLVLFHDFWGSSRVCSRLSWSENLVSMMVQNLSGGEHVILLGGSSVCSIL